MSNKYVKFLALRFALYHRYNYEPSCGDVTTNSVPPAKAAKHGRRPLLAIKFHEIRSLIESNVNG